MTQSAVTMQVRNDLQGEGLVTVVWQGEARFTLAPGEVKSMSVLPGDTDISVEGAFGRVPFRFSSAGHQRILLSVSAAPRTLLQRLTGKTDVFVREIRRKTQPAAVPPSPRLMTLQVWAGWADSATQFYSFVGERPDYHARSEEDEEYALSDFIEAQGQKWFDHDFAEPSFAEAEGSSVEPFKGSWSDKWAPWVAARAEGPVNAVWFMVVDTPSGRPAQRPVTAPRDVSMPGLTLAYLGECTFEA